MPSDSDVEATIAQLERELTPIAPAEPEPEDVTPSVSEGPGWEGGAPPEPPGPSLTLGVTPEPSSAEEAILTADVEPMLAAHDESPFEEPVEDFTAAAVEIEAPVGIHIEEAPLAAEMPTPWSSDSQWRTGTHACPGESCPSRGVAGESGEARGEPCLRRSSKGFATASTARSR